MVGMGAYACVRSYASLLLFFLSSCQRTSHAKSVSRSQHDRSSSCSPRLGRCLASGSSSAASPSSVRHLFQARDTRRRRVSFRKARRPESVIKGVCSCCCVFVCRVLCGVWAGRSDGQSAPLLRRIPLLTMHFLERSSSSRASKCCNHSTPLSETKQPRRERARRERRQGRRAATATSSTFWWGARARRWTLRRAKGCWDTFVQTHARWLTGTKNAYRAEAQVEVRDTAEALRQPAQLNIVQLNLFRGDVVTKYGQCVAAACV